jgi:hypothetical protein
MPRADVHTCGISPLKTDDPSSSVARSATHWEFPPYNRLFGLKVSVQTTNAAGDSVLDFLIPDDAAPSPVKVNKKVIRRCDPNGHIVDVKAQLNCASGEVDDDARHEAVLVVSAVDVRPGSRAFT